MLHRQGPVLNQRRRCMLLAFLRYWDLPSTLFAGDGGSGETCRCLPSPPSAATVLPLYLAAAANWQPYRPSKRAPSLKTIILTYARSSSAINRRSTMRWLSGKALLAAQAVRIDGRGHDASAARWPEAWSSAVAASAVQYRGPGLAQSDAADRPSREKGLNHAVGTWSRAYR